jgi:hypothetical protein
MMGGSSGTKVSFSIHSVSMRSFRTITMSARSRACWTYLGCTIPPQHRAIWDITVDSEPGGGSTFTIRLPRIVEAPKEVAIAQPIRLGARSSRSTARYAIWPETRGGPSPTIFSRVRVHMPSQPTSRSAAPIAAGAALRCGQHAREGHL